MNPQNYKTDRSRLAPAGKAPLLARPGDVVKDPALTLEQKRSTLAAWLSNLHAIPDAPRWRQLEDGSLVDIDEIYGALRALDDGEGDAAGASVPKGKEKSRSWIRSIIPGNRTDDDDDPPPCPAVPMRPVPLPGSGGSASAPASIGA